MSTDRYETVARVGDLVEGRGQSFRVRGRSVAVFLDEGTYYAVDDACPHKGLPIVDGFVFDASVTCTWHGWRFRLTDGGWLDNPSVRLGTYPVRVLGDEIQVAVG